MDKKERKIKIDEIMSLVANEQYLEACKIADEIEWQRITSFTLLHKISNLYKVNCRYEEAIDLILMAYNRCPSNKNIVYSICDLYLEVEDLVNAEVYMDLFNRMAPRDVDGAILKFKQLELVEAPYETRVKQLEKITSMRLSAEWEYQLAEMYHCMGLATKCVEICDKIFTMFGDGPFVMKALELKMLHKKLSPVQQDFYNHSDMAEVLETVESDDEYMPGADDNAEEDFHVKTIDMSKWNTINLQNELRDSMRELLGEDTEQIIGKTDKITQSIVAPLLDDEEPQPETVQEDVEPKVASEDYVEGDYVEGDYVEGYAEGEYAEGDYVEGYAEGEYTEDYVEDEYVEGYMEGDYADGYVEGDYAEGDYIEGYTDGYVEGYDEEQYEQDQVEEEQYLEDETAFIGDIDVRKLIDKEVKEAKAMAKQRTEQLNNIQDDIKEDSVEDLAEEILDEIEQPVHTGNTGRLGNTNKISMTASISETQSLRDTQSLKKLGENVFFDDKTEEIIIDEVPLSMLNSMIPGVEFIPSAASIGVAGVNGAAGVANMAAGVATAGAMAAEGAVTGAVMAGDRVISKRDKRFEDVLSLENDGQIKLVVPESKKVEKQITGQLNVEDVLRGWDNMIKERDAKQKAEVKKNILEQTGKIFDDYNNSQKNSMFAQIEQEQKEQRKVLKSDLDLKNVDELLGNPVPEQINIGEPKVMTAPIPVIAEEIKEAVEEVIEEPKPFDATEQLNKTYDSVLWDEVEQAIELDAQKKAAAEQAFIAEQEAENVEAINAEYTEDMTEQQVLDEQAYADGASEEEMPIIENESEDLDVLGEQDYLDGADYADAEYYEDEYYDEGTDYSDEVYDESVEYAEDGEYYEDAVYDESSESATYEESAYEEASYEEPAYSEAVSEEPVYEEPISQEEQVQPVTDKTVKTNFNTEQIANIGNALEAQADIASKKAFEEINDEYVPSGERELSVDEQELFEDFLYSKKMSNQILKAIEQISLASYVGNVIITGESSSNVLNLAKAVIKEIQMTDSNFVASKVAKISGNKMNQKDISGLFMQLSGGALIIEKAGKLTKSTLENITRALENLNEGIIVILTDTKKEVEKLIRSYGVLTGYFNARIDIVPMNSNALVEYAKKYAYSQEYKIDEEKAVLALHARISELQIGEHHVTTKEVENIIDQAIEHSKKPHLRTFVDIIIAKRYDYEDMIILNESDF